MRTFVRWRWRILLLVLPLVLFLVLRERLSWRPRLLGVHPAGAVGLLFSPDGQVLASGGQKALRLWDVHASAPLATLAFRQYSAYRPLCFSPDGSVVIVSAELDESGASNQADLPRPCLLVCDISRNVVMRVLAQAGDELSFNGAVSAALSQDGSTLLSVHRGDVRTWDIRTGKILRKTPLARSADPAASVSADISRDRKHLLYGAGSGVTIRTAQTGRIVKTLPRVRTEVEEVGYSSDGKLIAVVENGGLLQVYSAETGCVLWSNGPMTTARFSPDAELLACDIGSVTVFHSGNGAVYLQPSKAPVHSVAALAFSPDGATLASATQSGSIWFRRIR